MKKIILSLMILGGMSAQAQLKDTVTLKEMVISANKWAQPSNTVPSKISTISAPTVALQNPQTAADLLGLSGKVFIQKSQQGGGSPMIRGYATNKLVYTVDGVRMNTAIFRAGNIQNVINLDPFATQSTEVLFGPGSVIYGSDAIGGVMSFQTLVPQMSNSNQTLVKGSAVGRYSSANDEKTGHFDVNVGWKKWALLTSISSWDYGNLKQGSHGPKEYLKSYYVERQDGKDQVITQENSLLQIPSAYSQMNMMQKVSYKPNEKWSFDYGFHYSETSPYGRYDRHNQTKKSAPKYAEWNYGPQKWMMNNLTITNNAYNPAYDQMTVRLAQQYFEESRINRKFNDNLRTIQTEKVDAYSANIDFSKATERNNELFYGFEFVTNKVNSAGVAEDIVAKTSVAAASRYPQADWTSLAVYVNDDYKVNDKLNIQAGLRYNRYIIDAQFDTTLFALPFTKANINKGALSGSVGGVYRPTKSWVISANLGTAFRSPNLDDIGKVFDSEPGAVVVPNVNLEAEYAYNADLSIAKTFGDFLKVDLTGYYSFVNNALVRRNYRLDGKDSIVYQGELSRVQAIQNAARADVYGVQAGFELKLGKGFSLSSDYNYQRGTEEMDNGDESPAGHVVPAYGVTRLTYNRNKLNMQLYATYAAECSYEDMPESEKETPELYAKDKNGNPYSPAWYSLNFKSMYKVSNNLSVNAGVENITDQRYRPFGCGISAPGRNFILSCKVSF